MRAGLAATRRARMRSGGHRRGGTMAACCAAVGLVLLAAACGPASGSASGQAPAAGADNSATFAMQPGGLAQYPFPFIGSAQGGFDSVYNVDEFQYLLYRPLYWFGEGVKPYMNPQLSLALPPKYHGHEVIIRLKHNYRWSDGEAVDAQDVVFWLNMMKAEGGNDVFFSQTGLPSDVSNVRTVGSYEVTMDITTAQFSQSWFSSNELSEITPMPLAWDVTSAGAKLGSGGCSAASYSSIKVNSNPNDANPNTAEPPPISASAKACAAVFNYLTAQSSKPVATFASSPLWSVVDGPWKLKKLDVAGNLTLAYNNKYSGPVTPGHITTFSEVPFTSEQAEYNVLQDPTAGQTIDVGYLPTVDAPTPPAGALVGSNPSTLANYQLSAQYLWQLSYMPYNFQNDTGQAPIFDQLYFRKAFQMLVDQEGVINGPLHGYGKPTIGPVTSYPQTTYLSPKVVQQGDRWALNIEGAKTLLSKHGWKLEGGTFTCTHAGSGSGECGAGIPAGRQLKFTMMYASGIDWMQSAARELASNASLAGIQLSLDQVSFGDVVDAAFGIPPAPTCRCKWQLALWGSWTYSPDYLPTGDTLFQGNVFNNAGNYDNTKNNQLITATLKANTPAQFDTAMHTWDYWLTNQLPVVYEPDQATLVETIKGLDTGTLNSTDTITPEEWHYLK